MTYLFDMVINNIAALTLPGITIMDVAPYFAEQCKTPSFYPSYSPSAAVTLRERLSAMTTAGTAFKRVQYSLNWIYLHIQEVQGVDQSKYEHAIRQNLAAFMDLIEQHDIALGVEEVVPLSATIAERVIEIGGKSFHGGQVVLIATEFINQ